MAGTSRRRATGMRTSGKERGMTQATQRREDLLRGARYAVRGFLRCLTGDVGGRVITGGNRARRTAYRLGTPIDETEADSTSDQEQRTANDHAPMHPNDEVAADQGAQQ